MTLLRFGLFSLVILCLSGALAASLPAQSVPPPATRLLTAPTLAVPGRVDSSVPMTWTRVAGELTLVAFASWGGAPMRMAGPDIEALQVTGDVVLTPHPGNGIWFESVIADETDTTWYAYYHDELPAYVCGRPDRSIPRLGAAVSTDRGVTWQNLGIILEAPPHSDVCSSSNRYVIGGVGDVSVMVDREWKDVYLYFSNYGRDPGAQGVLVARFPWADRDAPQGRVTVWQGTFTALEYLSAAVRHAAQSHSRRILHQRRHLHFVRTNARRPARVEHTKEDSEWWRLVSAGRWPRAWQRYGQGDGRPWAVSCDRPLDPLHRVQVDRSDLRSAPRRGCLASLR